MCLILFSYKIHPRFDLILAGNRDEFYDRPTAPLDFFTDHPDLLGGRDLKEMGTWLGLTREGRLAAITNFRDPEALKDNAPSRGSIVKEFLTGHEATVSYLETLHQKACRFSGFNLIAGTIDALCYYSNMEGKIREIPKGVHGLSNHLLDTPWPKVSKGKEGLAALIDQAGEGPPDPEAIFDLLSDETHPPDETLPDTRVGQEWERLLSPIFIKSPGYGTRSSAILLVEKGGNATFMERTFLPECRRNEKGGPPSTRTVSFFLGSRP